MRVKFLRATHLHHVLLLQQPILHGVSGMREKHAARRTWLTAILSKNMRMSTNRPNKLKQNQKAEPVMRFEA
jgi:hypothetical protein